MTRDAPSLEALVDETKTLLAGVHAARKVCDRDTTDYLILGSFERDLRLAIKDLNDLIWGV